jgi:uncharacterized membrane protein YhfC
MKNRFFWLFALIIISLFLTGCAAPRQEPIQGARRSGSLEKEQPGSELDFIIPVEEGDPVGLDFRGVLSEGSIKLHLTDMEFNIYKEWTFDKPGPFSLNTTLYPPAGEYRYGITWKEPVTLSQYSLAWKPHPIEVPNVTAWALLPGLGMVLVALGFVIYTVFQNWDWRYLGWGALGWAVTVALKFSWAIPLNGPIQKALYGLLPPGAANGVFYLYVGLLTGIFEVLLIWLVLRYTKLGQAPWERALVFGIGFGALEALFLGVSSLPTAVIALRSPASVSLSVLENLARTSNPLYGLAPVWERFFTVFIHLFTNVLLFYGARERQSRWLWIAFAFKTGIDAVAAFAQFWGLDTLGRIWTIEAVVALWGIAGWLGTQALRKRYPDGEPG